MIEKSFSKGPVPTSKETTEHDHLAKHLSGMRVQERRWFFDTVIHPDEKKPDFINGTVRFLGRGDGVRLFGNRNLGKAGLCNMQLSGVLPSDMTARFDQMVCKLWAFHEDLSLTNKLFDALEAGTHIELEIGDQRVFDMPLVRRNVPEGFVGKDMDYSRIYEERFELSRFLPVRQCFYAYAIMQSFAKDALLSFPGEIFMQVWLGGEISRAVF